LYELLIVIFQVDLYSLDIATLGRRCRSPRPSFCRQKKFISRSFTSDDVLAFAGINTFGMDTSGLSSNWKKLQATLKRGSSSTSTSSAKKRKASDRDSGHGTVKKQKSEKERTKTQDTKTLYKRKRMSDGAEVVAKAINANSANPALRRKSSASVSAQTETGLRSAKVNEGRSPT